MTFWQGLVISIIVSINQGGRWDSDKEMNPREKAAMVQNILICLEMLFFSIAHWCVFPTDEWEPGYRPREYAKPGIGIKDFVEDISYIASSRKLSRHSRRSNELADSISHNDSSSNGLIASESDAAEFA